MELGPRLIEEVFALRAWPRTILLVEQNARMALGVADDAHMLEVGPIRLCGAARQIVSDPQLLAARLRG